MMTKEELINTARLVALNMAMDPALVCSVCATESSWNPNATRYEPGFFRRYISSMKGLTEDEMGKRATSFGLLQIMGQVARELGFDGKDLIELLDPMTGLTYGCRKLKRCLEAENGNVPAALLKYNGGGNAHYPDAVLSHYKDYAYLNATSRQG